jgi:hypothetical protein
VVSHLGLVPYAAGQVREASSDHRAELRPLDPQPREGVLVQREALPEVLEHGGRRIANGVEQEPS